MRLQVSCGWLVDVFAAFQYLFDQIDVVTSVGLRWYAEINDLAAFPPAFSHFWLTARVS